MVKAFDGTFWTGAVLIVASLVVAIGAIVTPSLPVIGSGRGALIAVAVLGLAACAVAGVGQAPAVGWTHPTTIVGIVLGVLALLVIVAGLAGWTAVVEPVGNLASRVTGTMEMTVERSATVALAGIILVKWVVGIGLALSRGASVA